MITPDKTDCQRLSTSSLLNTWNKIVCRSLSASSLVITAGTLDCRSLSGQQHWDLGVAGSDGHVSSLASIIPATVLAEVVVCLYLQHISKTAEDLNMFIRTLASRKSCALQQWPRCSDRLLLMQRNACSESTCPVINVRPTLMWTTNSIAHSMHILLHIPMHIPLHI